MVIHLFTNHILVSLLPTDDTILITCCNLKNSLLLIWNFIKALTFGILLSSSISLFLNEWFLKFVEKILTAIVRMII